MDGHNIDDLDRALRGSPKRPRVIIADTIKGKGVCFMEDRLEWHYKSPDDEQCRQALDELERKH